ncbi:hypothetical protein [Micromonospora sp. NPDC047074]|uniref:hypothetical protein n=1 Tax=Micromonospora sp. NPDC047074 TaxID=3154339 RepID=UPI0033DEB8B6
MTRSGRTGRRRAVACALVLTLAVAGCGRDGVLSRGPAADGADRLTAHTATADRGDLRAATFVLPDGADTVRLRSADLGDALYRVTTPTGARVRPAVTMGDGSVRAGLAATAGAGPALVEVALHEAVRWRIQLSGGAREKLLDLRGGRLDEVEFSAGTDRAEITLPPAAGTVRVSMSGGASRFLVHLAGDAPVRVRANSGAGTVTVDGVTRTGVAGGTTVTPAGWAGAEDRYDIDAVAGVSELVVDRA